MMLIMNTASVFRTILLVALLTVATTQLRATPTPNIPVSTTYDVTLESGRSGHSYACLDQNVYIQSDPLFAQSHPSGLNAFTLSFYMQQVSQPLYPQLLVYAVGDITTGPIALYSYSSLSMYVDVGTTQNIPTGIKNIFDGSWHQVTMSWSSAPSGLLSIYVDSNLKVAKNVSASQIIQSGGYLSLGQRRLGDGAFTYFDDFLFYDHALSTSDIMSLGMTTASSPLSTKLTGSLLPNIYWSFNQPILVALNSEGQVIVDDSGNGYSARVYSATHSFPVIVPSTLVSYSDISKTVLFPSLGVSTDYTVQLAQSGSSIHSTYTATSVKITSLPDSSLVQLYHLNSAGVIGAAIAVNDVIVGDTTTPTSIISVLARVSASFVLTSTTSFDYTIAPMNTSLPSSISSTISIGGNSRPLAGPPTGYTSASERDSVVDESTFTFSYDVAESTATTIYSQWLSANSAFYIYGQDPDGETTYSYLVSVPVSGVLFQTSADEKANINPITTASYSSPILFQHQQFVYRAPLGSDSMPSLNMTVYISDGRQTSLNPRIMTFNIIRSPHLPQPAPFTFSAKQDSMTLIQLPIDSSLLNQGDKPYITITELPSEGSLYQVNPVDGSVGALIGNLGRDSNPITQWLSSVDAVSSFYPDPHGWWGPEQILGTPNFFPSTGGSPNAWAGLNSNSDEWIEASFDTPVYITAIEIFETDTPGHVSNIYAKHPSSPVGGTPMWVLLWHNDKMGPPISDGSKADILSPILCPSPFATSSIRIETSAVLSAWVELDAVRVTGVTASARTDIIDLQQRVYYSAPHLARGMDSFKYTANSCRYYGLYRDIGVAVQQVNTTIIPVNHAPVASNLTITTDAYGVGSFAGLAGSDPDGDAIQYEIVSLPADGQLWINTAGGSTTDTSVGATLVTADILPLSIPTTTTFRYEATSTCSSSDVTSYQTDSFTYRSVDLNSIAPQMSSAPTPVQVQHYCIKPDPLSSSLDSLILFFVVLGIAVCLVIIGIFIHFRNEAVVKASSMLFNLISLTGCIGLFLSLIPLIQTDLNNHWCFARWAVPCLSFTLLFSSLFAKTFRIYKIFMNTKFSDRVLSNLDLLKFVFTGVGIISIILLIYGVVDKPTPIYAYTLNDSHTVYGGCTTNNIFRGLLLASQGALILAGTYLTILVRNVPSLFNEGSYIGITIYNALVLGILGIILDFVLVDNVHGQAIVRCFLLIVGTSVVISVLYGTKVYQIYQTWALTHGSRGSTDGLRKRLHQKLYDQAIKNGKTPARAEEWAKEEVARRLMNVSGDTNQIRGGTANDNQTVLSNSDEVSTIGGGGPGMTRLSGVTVTGRAPDYSTTAPAQGKLYRNSITDTKMSAPFPLASNPKLSPTNQPVGGIELAPTRPDDVLVRIHTDPMTGEGASPHPTPSPEPPMVTVHPRTSGGSVTDLASPSMATNTSTQSPQEQV